MEFQTGLTSKDFGANSFYSPKYPEQYERIRTLFTSINLRKVSGMATISSNIYWRRNQDQFALFRNHIPQWYKSDNYHLTNVIGGGCNISFTTNYGTVSSGVDIRSEKILSNILGEPLPEPVKVPWNDTVEFIKGHTRFHNGVFIEYSTDFRKLHISLGSMAAFNSDNNNKITLYPGFDLNYKISNRLMLYGSVNRALRMPSFTELYYSSPVIRGNEELFPEKAITFESGLKFFNREIKAHLSLFRRSGSDIIDWVKYPADSIWTAMNHTEINVTGIEFNFIWRPFSLSNKKTCLQTLRIGYGYINSDKMSGEMQSRYILDHLRHKTDVGINWKIAEVISFSLLMSYQQRAGRYVPFDSERNMIERPYPPVFLIDGKISLNLKSISFYAEATNILDLKYFDYANVPLPGRWLKAGAVVDLNLKKSVVKEKIPDRNNSFN